MTVGIMTLKCGSHEGESPRRFFERSKPYRQTNLT